MELRQLVLRSNRILGSTLVDLGLITISDLEEANEILVQRVRDTPPEKLSILNILLLETKKLLESDLIQVQVQQRRLALINLRNYRIRRLDVSVANLDTCRGTMTLPFDKVGTYTMVGSAYLLSRPTVEHWERLIEGKVLWYVCGTSDMIQAIERISGGEGEGEGEKEAKAS